jgi:hypothetical protein
MAKRTLRVDMDEILDAMTSPPETMWLLDLETGQVEFAGTEGEPPPDEEDGESARDDPRYTRIPGVESGAEYALMREFAEAVDEEDVRRQLEIALAGRGAFRRFRDVVCRYPDLEGAWLGQRRDFLLSEARQWFESLEIEPVYELRPIEGTPTPAPQPAKRRIGFLDLLLLGAPEGKTELLEGRVYRLHVAPTESEARGVFRHLARELTEWHGIAWRKRFIEGRDTYEVDRYHLRVDGARVELWIDVPRWLWQAFSG